MNEVSNNKEQAGTRWFIDLDWFQQNERSFFVLAQACLCPECRERLKVDEEEVTDNDLLPAIKDCCSKVSGFITPNSPILESVFRLFLANGNQPLDLKELGRQLGEGWGGSIYRISTESLYRLLCSDQYYGLSQVES